MRPFSDETRDEDGGLVETPVPTPLITRVPAGTFTINAATTNLSQTGLFRDLPNLLPADGVIPYDVIVPLFSDDARKRRWIVVPSTAQITFSPNQPWTFPAGTMLVKHFEIQTAANTFRKLETRLLVRNATGWNVYMFIWNAAETDATLSTATSTTQVSYFDTVTGLSQTRTWTFPGAQCLRCHVNQSGVILGVNTIQLNRTFNLGGTSENQLTFLNRERFFTNDIGSSALLPAYPALSDAAAPLEQKAKAYLGVNCAHCHQPGGPNAFIDFRYSTPLAAMNIVNVVGNAGIPRLVPGSKENSLIWNRIRTETAGAQTGRMPPVGRSVAHDEAVDLIGAWIDAQ